MHANRTVFIKKAQKPIASTLKAERQDSKERLNSTHTHTMTSRLVLVIGDLHIPDRAIDIPAKVPPLLFASPTNTWHRTLSAWRLLDLPPKLS